jgi:hypothetical protein
LSRSQGLVAQLCSQSTTNPPHQKQQIFNSRRDRKRENKQQPQHEENRSLDVSFQGIFCGVEYHNWNFDSYLGVFTVRALHGARSVKPVALEETKLEGKSEGKRGIGQIVPNKPDFCVS